MIKQPPYMGIRTFLGRPFQKNLEEIDAKVAVIGLPYDSGVSNRTGCRFGPESIRRSSLMLCEEWPFQAADLGDLFLGYAESPGQMHAEVTSYVHAILNRKLFPLFLGGDHSVTLPILRAYKEFFGRPIPLIQLDAHPDTWENIWGMRQGHGNFLYNAIKENLIDEEKSLLAGIRCPLDSETLDFTTQHVGCVLTSDEIHEKGWGRAFEHLKRLEGLPAYFSLDIDILDPSFAPGTGTPEIGGLSTWQVLNFLKNPLMQSIHWAGMDLVEVSPPYDHGEITSLAAASFLFFFLNSISNQFGD